MAALSSALMVAIGVAFYDLRVPTDPRRLLVLAGLFALGVTACSLLKLACTRLIRNAKAGAAVVQPPFLVLLFVSGVFFVFDRVPEPLQRFGALFPVKWLAQGLRYVFLPDWFSAQEAAGRWELATWPWCWSPGRSSASPSPCASSAGTAPARADASRRAQTGIPR